MAEGDAPSSRSSPSSSPPSRSTTSSSRPPRRWSLAFGKLEVGKPEEARLGIEALRAWMPVLEPVIPGTTKRDLQQALANLQLAYAAAVSPKHDDTPPAAGADEPDPD